MINLFKSFMTKQTDQTIQFGNYEVLVVPGTSSKLITSCAGVGNIQNDSIGFEFKESLNKVAPEHHRIFIKDLGRTWYTETNGRHELVEFIKNYLVNYSISNSVVFGMSMGGYGALVMDSLIKFDKVVVISGRSGIGGDVPFDTRNKKLLNTVNSQKFNSIENFQDEVQRIHMLFSMDEKFDLFHAYRASRLFPQIKMHVVRGDHNLGHEYRVQGRIKNLINWIISIESDVELNGSFKFSNELLKICNEMLSESYLEKPVGNGLKLILKDIDANKVPAFLFKDYTYQNFEKQVNRTEKKISHTDYCDLFTDFITLNSYLTYRNCPSLFKFGWLVNHNQSITIENSWATAQGCLIDYNANKKYRGFVRYKLKSTKELGEKVSVFTSESNRQVINIPKSNQFGVFSFELNLSQNGNFNIIFQTTLKEHSSDVVLDLYGIYFHQC